MSVQMIPAYILQTPNWVQPAMRVITLRVTREGVETPDYKLCRLFSNIDKGEIAVDMPLHDGTQVSMTFLAEAIDGPRALMLLDSQPDRYGALRLVNLYSDLDLTIDLNDGTGGGSAEPTEPARIPAIVRHDGSPAIREVVAVERRTDGTWRFAGSNLVEESGDLSLQVTGGEVYTFGVDDYGIRFQANGAVEVGQAIRPTVFEGWLYQVTEAGTLPATEPEWWPIQGDNAAREVGTARLQAIRYYQPIGHGPVNYELIP